jgi:hypothetical protein
MKPFNLSELNLENVFDKWDEVHEEYKRYPKQSLGHRGFLCEQIIESESNGKLNQLNDHPLGDFIDNNGLYYESKEVKNAFKRHVTPEIIVKNFRGKCLGKPGKTYDYMIVVDRERRMIAMFDHEYVNHKMIVKDATITVRLEIAKAIQTKSLSEILL